MTLTTLTSALRTVTLVTAVSSLGALVLTSPALASAQEQQPPQAGSADTQDMMAMRKNMMAMRQKMMEDTKAADAKLQQLVEQMNAAAGDAKLDAVAAVLTELVAQHRTSQQRMGQMMMPGMMQMMGMMEGMSTNMQRMMKEQGGAAPQP